MRLLSGSPRAPRAKGAKSQGRQSQGARAKGAKIVNKGQLHMYLISLGELGPWRPWRA